MAIRHFALIGLALFAFQIGCGKSDPAKSAPQARPAARRDAAPDRTPVELEPDGSSNQSPAKIDAAAEQPEVEIVTSLGTIRLQLFPEKSPRTVDNFLENYVARSAYDGTIVHYVDPEFMVAFGGFNTQYKPIETRAPVLNEADNGLQNVAGSVAMARMPDYVHSATCQFFINVVDNESLDYREQEDGGINGYCVFGKVVSGMDVVKKIAATKTADRDGFPSTPTPPVTVKSVRRVK